MVGVEEVVCEVMGKRRWMRRDDSEGKGRAPTERAIVHLMSVCCGVKAIVSGGSWNSMGS